MNCSTSGEVTRLSISTDGFDPRAVHQRAGVADLSGNGLPNRVPTGQKGFDSLDPLHTNVPSPSRRRWHDGEGRSGMDQCVASSIGRASDS